MTDVQVKKQACVYIAKYIISTEIYRQPLNVVDVYVFCAGYRFQWILLDSQCVYQLSSYDWPFNVATKHSLKDAVD